MKNKINDMLKSKLVRESKSKIYPHISSLNFTKKAFFAKEWNDLTIKARGFFINNQDHSIVMRSYDKFFNIDEHETTKQLVEKIKFPLNVYLKENGFLGIVGYDNVSGDLLISSKSSFESDFAGYFKELFNYDLDSMKEFVKKNNCSLIFEVIDINNDPHIIEYDKSKIVLLDIIYNEFDEKKMSYEDILKTSMFFGFNCKQRSLVINNQKEYENFINKFNKDLDFNHEGYVLEDSNNLKFKIKSPYYNYLKFMRTIMNNIQKCQSLGKEYDYNATSIKQRYLNFNLENYEKAEEFIYYMMNNNILGLNIIEINNNFNNQRKLRFS